MDVQKAINGIKRDGALSTKQQRGEQGGSQKRYEND